MGWGRMVLLKKQLPPVRIKWSVPKQFIRIRSYLQFCLHVTNAVAKMHYPKNCWAVNAEVLPAQRSACTEAIFSLACLAKAIQSNNYTDQPVPSIISGSFQSNFLLKPTQEPPVTNPGQNQCMSKTYFLVYPFITFSFLFRRRGYRLPKQWVLCAIFIVETKCKYET